MRWAARLPTNATTTTSQASTVATRQVKKKADLMEAAVRRRMVAESNMVPACRASHSTTPSGSHRKALVRRLAARSGRRVGGGVEEGEEDGAEVPGHGAPPQLQQHGGGQGKGEHRGLHRHEHRHCPGHRRPGQVRFPGEEAGLPVEQGEEEGGRHQVGEGGGQGDHRQPQHVEVDQPAAGVPPRLRLLASLMVTASILSPARCTDPRGTRAAVSCSVWCTCPPLTKVVSSAEVLEYP